MRPIGHAGFGLVLTAIVVSTMDEPAILWFTAVAVPASVLPDVDLLLPMFLHQGVIHTYPVMLLASVAVGLVAAGAVAAIARRKNSDGRNASRGPKRISRSPMRAFGLTTGAMVLGTFSHVTSDVVAYRESFTSKPVEPLWPFTDWVPRINVFPPDAPAWNYGFLFLGVALWLAVLATERRRRV